MDRKPVESSQIRSIGYDPEARKLEIEFHSYNPDKPGSVYEYDNVEPELHAELMREKDDDGNKFSVGRHFGKTLKADPKRYPYRKLPRPV